LAAVCDIGFATAVTLMMSLTDGTGTAQTAEAEGQIVGGIDQCGTENGENESN